MFWTLSTEWFAYTSYRRTTMKNSLLCHQQYLANTTLNKKVFLRERKRHTAVACSKYSLCDEGGYLPWMGVPILAGGYLPWMGWPLPWMGGYLPWIGWYLPWMGVPTQGMYPPPPPHQLEGDTNPLWTDTQTENITFPHPSDAGGN